MVHWLRSEAADGVVVISIALLRVASSHTTRELPGQPPSQREADERLTKGRVMARVTSCAIYRYRMCPQT